MYLPEALEIALVLILQLSMPVILAATGVGLTIGLLQALTQIQDQTLPHAVKVFAVAIVIIGFGAGLSAKLIAFATEIFSKIAAT